MKKSVLSLSTLGLLGLFGAVQAQEVGRVISSTPVIQQVAVPRQVCTQQPLVVQQPQSTSGGGAVIGSIVGGLAGNQIGGGSGRAAATALGVIGGALLGNSIEANQAPAQTVQNTQTCTTQTFYENRTVGYNVRYEFNGKEYNVQLPYDPGPTIRLQVTPVGAADPAPSGEAAAVVIAEAPQTLVAAPVVVPPAPLYPIDAGYAWRPSPWPPVTFSLGLGWVGGGGHHHHRHWR